MLTKSSNNMIKNKTYINAKDIGLVGDDATNDATKLNAWIASIGTTKVDLVFPTGVYKIASNVTFPSNVNLVMMHGGILKVYSGYSITGSGCKIDAGLWQIFDLSLGGTVIGSWDIEEVYPEWFGAKGDGVTDDGLAIKNSIKFSCFAKIGKTVFAKNYALYGDVEPSLNTYTPYPVNLVLEGRSGSSVISKGNVTVQRFWIVADTLNRKMNITVKDMTFDGQKTNTTISTDIFPFRLQYFNSVIIKNCTVKNHEATGIWVSDCNNVIVKNNTVLDCGDILNQATGDAYGDGIYVNNCLNVKIDSNYVKNDIADANVNHMLGRVGICVEFNCENAVIKNNYIFGYNRSIHTELNGYNSNITVENNKSIGSPCGILIWNESGNLVIKGNYVTNKFAYKNRSKVNMYGCNATFGYGILFQGLYNNTQVTIKDNDVKGYIDSSIFKLQPLIFASTSDTVQDENNNSFIRKVDRINIHRNIFDCGTYEVNEFNSITDNTSFPSTLYLPAIDCAITDNFFNHLGQITITCGRS